VKRRRFTYEDAQNEIEASDAELARGIRERRILSINGTFDVTCSIHRAPNTYIPPGQLRPIQPSYLITILELLLNYIVSFSLPPDEAPVEELIHALADQHEISRQVVTQVMSWFGDVQAGLWCVDVNAVLKEIGLGLLREHKVCADMPPISYRSLICVLSGSTILSRRASSLRNGVSQ
jgi:sister chromatid cohesion protein DCC1